MLEPAPPVGPAEPRSREVEAAQGGDVPAPLRPLIGPRLDDLAWRRLGIGIWHYRLPLSPGAKGDLRLYGRARPEAARPRPQRPRAPRCCSGGYRDEIGQFRTGDLADLDEDVEHSPIADASEGCICLIGHTEQTRFKA